MNKSYLHKQFFTILFFVAIYVNAFGQQKTIQYDRDFQFREGVYFTYLDFKNNNPIPTSKIISDYNKNNRDFISSVLNKPDFKYIDGFGKENTYTSNQIWGYCSNGTIFVNHGTDFNRVNIIGSICHFVATVKVRISAADPFYNNQPFGSQDRFTYSTEQFVIDYESGKILPFSTGNMEALLSRDELIYQEFNALKNRKKRESIFLYLRKYNEKHPIYFLE